MTRQGFYPGRSNLKLERAGAESIRLFQEDLLDNVLIIREHLAELGPNRQFVESLLAGFSQYERFTSGQLPWITAAWIHVQNVLQNPAEGGESVADSHESSRGKEINRFPGIRDLLLKARAKLQRPTIRWPDICIPEKEQKLIYDIRFYLAGEDSYYPGSIYLTCIRAVGQARTVLGFMSKESVNGDATISWSKWTEDNPDIKRWLVSTFAKADVSILLAEAGKQAVHCCYCGLALSDYRSVHFGYGPICASNWGLPWDADRIDLVDL